MRKLVRIYSWRGLLNLVERRLGITGAMLAYLEGWSVQELWRCRSGRISPSREQQARLVLYGERAASAAGYQAVFLMRPTYHVTNLDGERTFGEVLAVALLSNFVRTWKANAAGGKKGIRWLSSKGLVKKKLAYVSYGARGDSYWKRVSVTSLTKKGRFFTLMPEGFVKKAALEASLNREIVCNRRRSKKNRLAASLWGMDTRPVSKLGFYQGGDIGCEP